MFPQSSYLLLLLRKKVRFLKGSLIRLFKLFVVVVIAGKGGEHDFKMMKNLVRISTQDILDSYMIGKVIGEGKLKTIYGKNSPALRRK